MKKIKNRILAAVSSAAVCVSVSGCVNYSKLMQDDQWRYITIAAENTFKDMSTADKKIISELLPKGAGSSASLTVAHPEYGNYTFSGASDDKTASFGISADISGKNFSADCFSDSKALVFSVKGDGCDHAYSVPYSDFKEKLDSSVFGKGDPDSKYSLDEDTLNEIKDMLDDYIKKLEDRSETVDPFKELMTVSAESRDKVVDGETIAADVITYSISAESCDEYITDSNRKNLEGYLDEEELNEYLDMLREKTDLSGSLSFVINKEHRLVQVEFIFGGTYYDSPLNIGASVSFGTDPARSDKTNFYCSISDGEYVQDTAITVSKTVVDGTVLTKTAEIVSGNSTARIDLVLDAAAGKYTLTSARGEELFGLEGTVKADGHSLTIDLTNAYNNDPSVNLLEDWIISLNINDSAPRAISADREFLSLTEEETDKFLEDINNCLNNLFS